MVFTTQCTTCPRKQKVEAFAGAPEMMVCSVLDEGSSRPPSPEVVALLEMTPVGRVMTQDVSCVTADVSLDRLTKLFEDRRISCAPVVDDSGALIGLVTKSDVVCECFDFENEPPTDVADVMTRRPTTVLDTSTMAKAVPLLTTTHHLPVVSAKGNVVGIVSAQDIIRWLAGTTGSA